MNIEHSQYKCATDTWVEIMKRNIVTEEAALSWIRPWVHQDQNHQHLLVAAYQGFRQEPCLSLPGDHQKLNVGPCGLCLTSLHVKNIRSIYPQFHVSTVDVEPILPVMAVIVFGIGVL